jgi:fructokinase
MTIEIGIDIGGTKIAAASYDKGGNEVAQQTLPTPATYDAFLDTCRKLVAALETQSGKATSIGVCAPYADENTNANVPALIGKNLSRDLEDIFGRKIPFANDANCAALAEAREGAGMGYKSMFGLILGTGVGGGFILNGEIMAGANGMAAEIGHLPLPFYEPVDGSRVTCGCGQTGCIEKLICGAALARLHHQRTENDVSAKKMGEMAAKGNKDVLETLDAYYTTVAKAMVAILHTFDPEIITVSGGLSSLPGLYDEVPKRWGRYAANKNPVTKLVPSAFGSMAGLRGAALVGRGR